MEKTGKGHTSRNIHILSDSQTTIKALDSFQTNSNLVWDSHQILVKLAEHNTIPLVRVPGHMGINENEMAYELARQGSSHPLKGPEPAIGISEKGCQGCDQGLNK